MNVRVVEGPAGEPVSLEEAKNHLRVEHSFDDALITSLIVAAREWAEGFLNRALITQTRVLTISRWPVDPLRLPGGVIQSVESITYVDSDGQTGTVDAANYYLSASGDLVRSYGGDWPSTVTLRGPESISIRYVCGYGAAADVSVKIRQAMLLLIGHWYEHREGVVVGSINTVAKLGVETLLSFERLVPV